jgi:hypothetical protein
MVKNNPGGVTHKWNLSELYLFFFPLHKVSNKTTAIKSNGVTSLITQA